MSFKDAWLTGPGPRTKKEYIVLYLKGFLMGIADLIPGVSGGTIAFITGIYESLLEAVASVNKSMIKDVLSFKITKVVSELHLRFLVPLLFGILSAIFGLARLMHYLITVHPTPTWGAFFGLIAASIIVIWRELDKPFSLSNLAFILFGAGVGYAMVSLIPVSTPDGLWFIFLCGCIGISAMILPGLSGSFLLLILGKYAYITGAIKNPFVTENFLIMVTFAAGALTGIMGFSKVLNFCLKNYRNFTMAFLTGILIGSMKKVWPWRQVTESQMIRGKLRIMREENFIPTQLDGEFYTAIALIVLGFFAVLVMEFTSRNRKLVD